MMAGFRSRASAGAALALLAMALQLVSMLGHIHGGTSQRPLSLAVSDTLTAAAPSPIESDEGSAPRPHQDSDRSCAVCILASLLTSAIAASPPTWPAPVERALFEPIFTLAAICIEASQTSFWSRGPPQS